MYSILIADDDYYQSSRYMNTDIWNKYGFELVSAAQSEKQALDFLSKNKTDLVLTEVSRPQINGVRLAEEILREHRDTCVVFFSQRSDFEAARQGLRLGVVDYIIKPADEKELSEMLLRVKKRLDEKRDCDDIGEQAERVLKRLGKGSDNRFVRRVCAYLSDNIYSLVTMSGAAEYMKLNKDYFGKCFRKNTGISFGEFYNLIRIEYAKSLIESGRYRTYEISDKLGFSDPDYFTRKFKEAAGMTPSAYKASFK